MNQQYLEYLRGCVTTALGDIQRTGKDQSADSGTGIIRTTKYPRKRRRIVALEDRTVCAATDAMHCPETRTRKRPFPMIDPITFSTASWRRAVGELEPVQAAWLRYCYGNDLNYDYQVLVCQHIWKKYQLTLTRKRTTDKVRKRIESLVWLAAQYYASECGCILSSNKYKDSELASLVGVSKSTWSENYRPHWLGLVECVSLLDNESLNDVIKKRTKSRLKHLAT